jgi:hypothetical protein
MSRMGSVSRSSRFPNITLEEMVEQLLVSCYREIDRSYTIHEKYYLNWNLKSNIIELLKLLTKYCPKYIDGVFKDYLHQEIKTKGQYNYLWNGLGNNYIEYYKNEYPKIYHKRLTQISSINCKNSDTINLIYGFLITSGTKKYIWEKGADRDIDSRTSVFVLYPSDEMKGTIRNLLLQIKPMAENIRNIIITTPFSESTYIPMSSSNRQTSSSQKPTKYQTQGLNTLQPLPEGVLSTSQSSSHRGGKAIKTQKTKVIFGKERCIYKKSGDQKEYVKYKGDLITVKQYKNIIKNK